MRSIARSLKVGSGRPDGPTAQFKFPRGSTLPDGYMRRGRAARGPRENSGSKSTLMPAPAKGGGNLCEAREIDDVFFNESYNNLIQECTRE